MFKKIFIFSSLIFLMSSSSVLALANPASVFCEKQGYDLKIETEENGQVGYCIFPDGTKCEEWSYFYKCNPSLPSPDSAKDCPYSCQAAVIEKEALANEDTSSKRGLTGFDIFVFAFGGFGVLFAFYVLYKTTRTKSYR